VSVSQEHNRISEQEVLRFLEQNPDFFNDYPQVLADVRLHHESGKAVSLIERQVAVLRDQKKKLKRQLQELVDIARANDELDKRVHQLTLRLMECKQARDVLNTVRDYLMREFAADAVVVRLRPISGMPAGAPLAEFVAPTDREFEALERIILDATPLCGRFKHEQAVYFFGDQAEAIGSAALVPLRDASVFGLLAIGARDARRFHAGQGTVFLTQLGELVSRALRACLDG
jgi:uncharacterized protein YigA (DUF484 family)